MTTAPLVLKFTGTASFKDQCHDLIITVQQTSDEKWKVSLGSPDKSRSFDNFFLKYKSQDSLDDIKEKTLQQSRKRLGRALRFILPAKVTLQGKWINGSGL